MIRWILAIMGVNFVSIVALAFNHPAPMLFPVSPRPAYASLAKNCIACHVPRLGAVEAGCKADHSGSDIRIFPVADALIARAVPMAPFRQGPADTSCVN